MNKIIYLVLFSFLFTSCSDDSHQNFLERYDNSVWEYNFSNEISYTIFHDNISNPIVEWHKDLHLKCFYFFNIEDAGGELLEVSNNRVVFKIPHPGTTVYRNLTFTKNGNTINLKVEIFENGISKSTENYVLNRSDFNPHNVQICDNN